MDGGINEESLNERLDIMGEEGKLQSTLDRGCAHWEV